MYFFIKKLSFVLLLILTICATAQTGKMPLDHSVYDDWKTLSGQQLSNDGNWLSYEVNPQRGDGELHVVDLQNNVAEAFARGRRAVFAPNSDFLAFAIEPEAAAVRQAKVDGKSQKEMPKDKLGIFTFTNRELTIIENVASFAVAEKDASWIFYHHASLPEDTLEGTALFAMNPLTQETHQFQNVTGYKVSANGLLLAFTQALAGEEKKVSVKAFNTQSKDLVNVFEAHGDIHGMSIDEAGKQLAFVFSERLDNNHEGGKNTNNALENAEIAQDVALNQLYLWQSGQETAALIVDIDTPGMPHRWHASGDADTFFSEDGIRLFFGTAPRPRPQPKDTLLTEEKFNVDVWHYRDPLIQPMQLVQLEREKKRSYKAIYHVDDGRMVQLADERMPDVSINKNGGSSIALGESKLPYLIENSFESGDYRDVFLVDMHTGERTLVLEKHRGSVHLSRRGDARLSPGGSYLLWYSQADRSWQAMSVADRSTVNLTATIPYPMYDELHDAPSEPDPHGVAGWVDGDSYALIYDRFDIWKLDPGGKEPAINLTSGYGRNNNIRLRYVDLDPDNEFIGRRDRIMLRAFHLRNKQSGFYSVRVHRPGNPQQTIMEDALLYQPVKAANAEVIAWRRSTFEEFPDLWVSDLAFNDARKISNANPQQQEYLWGRVQLVEWMSFGGDSLQGLLYLPKDFEEGEKYPMIVYFYERLSDRLHNHYIPTPSRSTINISYCVSNGYIVFVPDIKYTVGYPGQSAYNAIVSGTKAMVNQFDFIDRQNIGIQGQSWAGYQIAWLITQTDMFKAAMAGAPVSNMISAYGGIRWSTGMSRIYQYEETQSRIGGTIWDQTLRYIENSPVFFANKVNTPLLMMHNDADGAVPWYQGIEYFMALRRLEKPVWMLNYNDEAHNLTRWPNRVDLSHRMYKFFDHYLKGADAPAWMTDGVPAIKKNSY